MTPTPFRMRLLGLAACGALVAGLSGTCAAMSDADRHAKSVAICTTIASTVEFQTARVVMLYVLIGAVEDLP